MTQTDTFIAHLPKKPYCTDDFNFGITIRPKEQAIKKKFIQPNNPWNWNYLVFDVDRKDAALDWFDLGCPAPTIVSQNPDNGHAHLFYGLDVPVYTQDGARNKPLRYAGAISVALSRKLKADPAYNGLLSKNPIHPHWITEIIDPAPYTLKGLAGYLNLGDLTDSRKHLPETALGRNCTLFDETRFWAYRQIRSPQEWLSEDFFIESVTEFAGGYNALNFAIKLPYSEIKAIGKSVGRWTYRNMSYTGFRAWCHRKAKAGNRASQRVRKAGAFEKAEQVRLYKLTHPEATIRAIAENLGLGRDTVHRALSDLPISDDSPVFLGSL